jgi:AcrR family transcriptional regulator
MTKGERTRAAILAEAADFASSVGLNGLTVGTLAARAGMSKTGLLQHFGSKERLQVETLKAARDRFIVAVVRPALATPRGIARIRALFDYWMKWVIAAAPVGGCIFVAASAELDDQPGSARDFLVDQHTQWLDVITETVRKAVEAGECRSDLDAEQFTFEFMGILLAFHQLERLMRNPQALAHARTMFERLLADAGRKPSDPPSSISEQHS